MTFKTLATSILALGLCGSVGASALTWLGVAPERAQVQDTWRMHDICSRTYKQPDSRWASTADYEEMFGSGNQSIRQESQDFALRAPDTIFTPDQRAYDQRTGTLSESGKYNYPGAVIIKPKGDSVFPGRKKEARPLCVAGKTLYQTNPRLR